MLFARKIQHNARKIIHMLWGGGEAIALTIHILIPMQNGRIINTTIHPFCIAASMTATLFQLFVNAVL